MSPRPAAEALERRRMQNRLAQRKRRQRRAELEREQQQPQQGLEQQGTRKNLHSENHKPPNRQDTLPHEPCVHCRTQASEKSNGQRAQEGEANEQNLQPPNVHRHFSTFEEPRSEHTSHNVNSESSTYSITHTPLPLPHKTLPPISTCFELQYLNGPGLDEDLFLDTDLGSPTYFRSAPASLPLTKDAETVRVLPTPPCRAEIKDSSDHDSGSRARTVSYTPTMTVASQVGQPQVLTSAHSNHEGHRRTSSWSTGSAATDYKTSLPTPSTWEQRKGKTALHLCAERGNVKIVQFLINNGAEIDALDGFGRTALHYAAGNSHADVVAKLLESGADTEVLDCEGLSPLHAAADVECEEVIKLLTQEGADLNAGIGIEVGRIEDTVLV